jgi:hypothetical protein
MWKKILINDNQVEAETEKSVLVKLAGKTNRFCWIAKKLCRKGTHKANFSFSFADNFEFKIIDKNSNVIQLLNAEEFEIVFNKKEEVSENE